jgi:hypothetical protein
VGGWGGGGWGWGSGELGWGWVGVGVGVGGNRQCVIRDAVYAMRGADRQPDKMHDALYTVQAADRQACLIGVACSCEPTLIACLYQRRKGTMVVHVCIVCAV